MSFDPIHRKVAFQCTKKVASQNPTASHLPSSSSTPASTTHQSFLSFLWRRRKLLLYRFKSLSARSPFPKLQCQDANSVKQRGVHGHLGHSAHHSGMAPRLVHRSDLGFPFAVRSADTSRFVFKRVSGVKSSSFLGTDPIHPNNTVVSSWCLVSLIQRVFRYTIPRTNAFRSTYSLPVFLACRWILYFQ